MTYFGMAPWMSESRGGPAPRYRPPGLSGGIMRPGRFGNPPTGFNGMPQFMPRPGEPDRGFYPPMQGYGFDPTQSGYGGAGNPAMDSYMDAFNNPPMPGLGGFGGFGGFGGGFGGGGGVQKVNRDNYMQYRNRRYGNQGRQLPPNTQIMPGPVGPGGGWYTNMRAPVQF